MSTHNKPTRRDTFLKEIDAALENSPYQNDVALHRLYCMGLLRELLLYSAIDQQEVRQRLKYIAGIDRNDNNR
jgi:hypothetical protein